MNREVQLRPSGAAYRAARSGAVAALLSFLFPGLGQAYLGRRRSALVFALPLILALVGLLVVLSVRGAVYRVIDPTIATSLIVLTVLLGLWWIAAIVDAWLGGRHAGGASKLVVAVLVLAMASGGAYATVQLGQLRNASIEIATGDNTLVDNPNLNATPTPSLPAGQTADPNASPTPRPPDWVDPEDNPSGDPEPSIAPGPTPGIDISRLDAQDDGLLNVLLGGVDWLPGRVGARTDTMVVLSINSATGEVLMFSFPRDLQGFPIYNGGTYNGKLNTFAGVTKLYPDQFHEPGIKSLAYQIGFILGVPIDYYASVNMVGFIDVVSAVGGVTVCNEREIADDQLQFYLSPGIHRLDPEDALRFVRSRHGQSGGDFARAHRQQVVLAALRKEMLKPENLVRIGDIANSLAAVINTNFPLDQIDQLVHLADQVEEEPSRSWVFKNPEWAELMTRAETGARQVLTPRLDRIAALSVSLFGEQSLYYGQVPGATPGASVSPAPSVTPSPAASATSGVCGTRP